MTKITAAIVGALIGLILPMQLAFAGGAGTLGPLSELTAEWWQWAASIPDVPDAPNPTSDMTGASCMVGQRDSIRFLAGLGAFGQGGTAVRACSVPEGTTIFFPVINSVFFNTPDCGQGGQSFNVKELRQMVKSFIDDATNLSVKVVKADGTKIRGTLLKRIQSEPFAAAFPQENFFGPNACATGQPLPAGIYSPSVDDGYYASIPPLKPGSYTLNFHAESHNNMGPVIQDITYNLTVVPVSLK